MASSTTGVNRLVEPAMINVEGRSALGQDTMNVAASSNSLDFSEPVALKPVDASIGGNLDKAVAGVDMLGAPQAEVPGSLKTVGAPEDTSVQDYKNAKLGIAGLGFMVNVLNANNAYRGVKGQAALNIMMARNNAADAIYRGRQAQMDAQSQGYEAGQDALLNAAAQGQDVSGAGTQKIQGSYEAMGIYNGMKEEINSMREALGYELEEIGYDYQVESAAIDRDMAIAGAALSFGASAYGISQYKGKEV